MSRPNRKNYSSSCANTVVYRHNSVR